MDKNSKICVIGAGLFGLSVARQLSLDGYRNIKVLDRHIPPVPDGSSNDISRVVRFDYADGDYHEIAYEAYQRWLNDPKYHGIFSRTHFILGGSPKPGEETWMDKTTAQLTKHNLPWSTLKDAKDARRIFPVLSGELAGPNFSAYHHNQAGWADAGKAITQLRDECIELGVSFICGRAGTVVGFETDSQRSITGVRTLAGPDSSVKADHFILTAGAWGSGLVPMYNSTLSTAQVVGYLPLTDEEMVKYKDLPLYINYSTGWFNFPPHEDTKTLKMAVHGWGYTRAPGDDDRKLTVNPSSPPLKSQERPNFVPSDGEDRLRQGLREMLPELASRPFDKVAMCWYTDTPTGDFIMDYHPDYKNLFIGGAGCGHAFKFFPVLGEYLARAVQRELPSHLADKWRFRKEYEGQSDAFVGDGSRGGPARRELTSKEREAFESRARTKAKL
ncbi:sarcosine oxidase [Colletotrichum karsti]|uniref:Sarcosine oxidase n=1 Tax=Colletotrichum karsti TaxID=1095194 RepID=A0A9P6I905_9PEZI|nr:sarcosine oxidase [Colletotrichum karsti]KAF9878184.1 sarcosine oxidase [Colletotrichum karsti]